jgi:hypothetical protein
MVVGRHDTDGWIDVWFIYSGYLHLLFRFIHILLLNLSTKYSLYIGLLDVSYIFASIDCFALPFH